MEIDWISVLKVVGPMMATGAISFLLGRAGYGRQRRDQLADRQRDADRQRLGSLMEALDTIEPLMREVKGMVDEAAATEGGIGPFLGRYEHGRWISGDWYLDKHFDRIAEGVGSVLAWLHDHAPELKELDMPADFRATISGLWDRLERARGSQDDDGYKVALLEMYALVAPLRDHLRKRFRFIA